MRKTAYSLVIAPLALVLALALLAALHSAALAQAAAPAGPTSPANPQDQAALRVNEVMADNTGTLIDPDEPGSAPDWFEIYNPGPTDVPMAGLGLADALPLEAGFVITSDIVVPAGGFVIFYADGEPKQGKFHTNFKLSNDGESVILYEVATKQIIDRIDFPALAADQSYGRLPDGSGAPDFLAAPSPGATNALNPPHISNVTQPPAPPAPVDAPVAISAIVTDTGALVNVTLHYSVTGAAQAVPMTPIAPDTYGASIPAQPANTLVTYYVSATDNDGATSRAPLPGRDYRYLTGYVPPKLYINEVVVENSSYKVDPDEPAETPDWIELYNPGADAVSLQGLSLTDDKDLPLRFVITAPVTIPAGGLITFLADDDKGQNLLRGFQPPLHLNFNLNKSGTYVGLYGGEGSVLIDSHKVNDPPPFGAEGRIPAGGDWSAAICPTFNTPNLLCDKGVFMPTISRR